MARTRTETKAKKKNVIIDLDDKVHTHLQAISDLSGVTINDVVSVILATAVYITPHPSNESNNIR